MRNVRVNSWSRSGPDGCSRFGAAPNEPNPAFRHTRANDRRAPFNAGVTIDLYRRCLERLRDRFAAEPMAIPSAVSPASSTRAHSRIGGRVSSTTSHRDLNASLKFVTSLVMKMTRQRSRNLRARPFRASGASRLSPVASSNTRSFLLVADHHTPHEVDDLAPQGFDIPISVDFSHHTPSQP